MGCSADIGILGVILILRFWVNSTRAFVTLVAEEVHLITLGIMSCS